MKDYEKQMLKYNKRAWITMGVVIAAFIIEMILDKRTDTGGMVIRTIMHMVGFCGFGLAIHWFRVSMTVKSTREYEIEKNDERVKLLDGKAAIAALYTMVFLLMAFAVLLEETGNMRGYWIIMGILAVSLLVYYMVYKKWEKKM